MSPLRPCGFRSRPTTRWRARSGIVPRLRRRKRAGALEERLDRIGRGRALGEPRLRLLDVERHLLLALELRLVRADDLDEAAVARRFLVGDDDTVDRELLAAGAAQSNASGHACPVPVRCGLTGETTTAERKVAHPPGLP